MGACQHQDGVRSPLLTPLARFFPKLTPVPSLLPSEHTFEINRERAIDYLNTRENVCQFPTCPLVLCPFLSVSADNSLHALYRRL